jgi:8-oxo-dGTP pyrophosphatase MutT (NUDIX family)
VSFPRARCITPTLTFSSVLLISPQNQILLLHRVQTSSSFASAHVFPGGALSAEQDGEIPPPESPLRHQDSRVYRMAAIRETFEECGILLAKDKKTGRLRADVSDEEREQGRRDVHGGKVKFGDLLERWGVEPDLGTISLLCSSTSCNPHIQMYHTNTFPPRCPHPLHPLGHAPRRPQTLHHANVPLLPSAQHHALQQHVPAPHRPQRKLRSRDPHPDP